MLPREILHYIFTLTEPGPNAIYLGAVCRDWRSAFEKLLYGTVAIFDRDTIHQRHFNCVNYNFSYYLEKEDQRYGVAIEKGNATDEGAGWEKINLLLRTLFDNDRLASYVREVDFCANLTHFTSFLSITETCRNITHLYLRGPEETDASAATTVKMAIKSLHSLQVFSSEGIFPLFSMLDTIALLQSCPKIHSLTVGLTSIQSAVDDLDPPSRESYGQFPELRELCFLALLEEDQNAISFPSSNDVHILSKVSLPNLASFSANLGQDPEAVTLMKKCLLTWASHLTKLESEGETSFDDIAPTLSRLTELTCNRYIFSRKTIRNFRSLKKLHIRGYIFQYKEIILDRLEKDSSKWALPHLTHLTTYIRDEPERTEEERRLLALCQASNITVEKSDYSGRRRMVTHYYD